jgi:ATP synthase protein I
MADGTRGTGDHNEPPDDEAALSARLQRLGKRLAQKGASREDEAGQPPNPNTAGIALGLRLSTELIAGVVVGAAIGWVLDRWLGISPWGFIVFLLLGFAAGLLNMLRSAGIVAERKRSERR